jgi:hypothetical protein
VVELVDWWSKSVVELEAFLRSRGVVMDLGGEGEGPLDKATLVDIAMAIAAEEQQEQQGEGGEEGGWVEAP